MNGKRILFPRSLLEGCRLDKTSRLKFISENVVDEQVINYHTQTYEFEAFLQDMLRNDTERIFGKFERLMQKRQFNQPLTKPIPAMLFL